MDNNLQNSLFEAMKQFVDASDNGTVIINAKIIKAVDEALGKYMVEYQNATFNATATNPQLKFSEEENVVVLVPNGDFTKDKIILSSAQLSVSNLAQTTQDEYISTSENLFDALGQIDMSSYGETNDSTTMVSSQSNFKRILRNLMKEQRDYIFSCEVFTELPLERQTIGNYGCGLTIPFVSNGEKTTKQYFIDTTNMVGAPYRMETWTKQEIIINIPDGFQFDMNEDIVFSWFDEGFTPLDETKINIKDLHLRNIEFKTLEKLPEAAYSGYYVRIIPTQGRYYYTGLNDVKTLSVEVLYDGKKIETTDDFQFYWFKENQFVDLNHDKYSYVGGVGWACLNSRSVIGTTEDNLPIYQFNPSDSTVDIDLQEVDTALGIKCGIVIDDKTTVYGDITLVNLLSTTEFDLSTADGTTKYPYSAAGRIQVNADIYLEGVTDVATESSSRGEINYAWKRYDRYNREVKNGCKEMYTNKLIEKDGKQYYQTAVSFPAEEVIEFNRITCSAMRGDHSLGTQNLTITTTSQANYSVIVEGENVVYKYDTFGNSPLMEAYNAPATARINEKNPIKAINYKIYNTAGTEISSYMYRSVKATWYVPINSMIVAKSEVDKDEDNKDIIVDDRYYTITAVGLEGSAQFDYGIATSFDRNKSDNSLILKLDIGGEIITRTIDILFTKEGDLGTNGTVYSAEIALKPLNSEEKYSYGERDVTGKEYKYKLICSGEETNVTSTSRYYSYKCSYNGEPKNLNMAPHFVPRVYKNGKPLTIGTDYTVEYNLYDDNLQPNEAFEIEEIDATLGEVRLKYIDGESTDYYKKPLDMSNSIIIVATVTISLESLADTQKQIFAYYPIEFIRSYSLERLSNLTPGIGGGFNEVVYASDGSNPSYDGSRPFRLDFGEDYVNDQEIMDCMQVSWEYDELFENETTNDTPSYIINLKPKGKFDAPKARHNIKASVKAVPDIDTKFNNIRDKRTTLNNLRTSYQNKRTVFHNFMNYMNNYTYSVEVDGVSTNITIPRLEYMRNVYFTENTMTQLKTCQKLLKDLEDLRTLYQTLQEELEAIQSVVDTNSSMITNTLSIISSNYNYIQTDKSRVANLVNYSSPNSFSSISTSESSWVNDLGSVLGKQVVERINNLEINTKATQVYNDLYNYYTTYRYNNTFSSLGSSMDSIQSNYNIVSTDIYNTYKNTLFNVQEGGTYNQKLAYFNYIYQQMYSEYFDLENDVFSLNEESENYDLQYTDTPYDEGYSKADKTYHIVSYLRDYYSASGDNYLVIISKPICVHSNAYESSNINGWDGNKIDLGHNNEYIMAPQVGAGVKNSDNTFTGIVMGRKNIYDSSQPKQDMKIGMFGSYHGIETMFLNAKNGAAIFGASGNQTLPDGVTTVGGAQIIIDPSARNALLYSSNYFENYNREGLPVSYDDFNEKGEGMLINLSKPEMKYGNRNFSVDEYGFLTANGGGRLAGWGIHEGKLRAESYDMEGHYVARHSNYSNELNLYDKDGNVIATGVSLDRASTLESGDENLMTLASGISRVYDSNGDMITKVDGSPLYVYDHERKLGARIFALDHDTLDSDEPGFYIDKDGASWGSSLMFDKNGVIKSGDVNSSLGDYFTITGNTSIGKPFISYGYSVGYGTGANANVLTTYPTVDGELDTSTNERNNLQDSCYFGSDGLAIGEHFKIAQNPNDGIKIAFKYRSLLEQNLDDGFYFSEEGFRLGNDFLANYGGFIKVGDVMSDHNYYAMGVIDGDHNFLSYGYSLFTLEDRPGEIFSYPTPQGGFNGMFYNNTLPDTAPVGAYCIESNGNETYNLKQKTSEGSQHPERDYYIWNSASLGSTKQEQLIKRVMKEVITNGRTSEGFPVIVARDMTEFDGMSTYYRKIYLTRGAGAGQQIFPIKNSDTDDATIRWSYQADENKPFANTDVFASGANLKSVDTLYTDDNIAAVIENYLYDSDYHYYCIVNNNNYLSKSNSSYSSGTGISTRKNGYRGQPFYLICQYNSSGVATSSNSSYRMYLIMPRAFYVADDNLNILALPCLTGKQERLPSNNYNPVTCLQNNQLKQFTHYTHYSSSELDFVTTELAEPTISVLKSNVSLNTLKQSLYLPSQLGYYNNESFIKPKIANDGLIISNESLHITNKLQLNFTYDKYYYNGGDTFKLSKDRGIFYRGFMYINNNNQAFFGDISSYDQGDNDFTVSYTYEECVRLGKNINSYYGLLAMGSKNSPTDGKRGILLTNNGTSVGLFFGNNMAIDERGIMYIGSTATSFGENGVMFGRNIKNGVLQGGASFTYGVEHTEDGLYNSEGGVYYGSLGIGINKTLFSYRQHSNLGNYGITVINNCYLGAGYSEMTTLTSKVRAGNNYVSDSTFLANNGYITQRWRVNTSNDTQYDRQFTFYTYGADSSYIFSSSSEIGFSLSREGLLKAKQLDTNAFSSSAVDYLKRYLRNNKYYKFLSSEDYQHLYTTYDDGTIESSSSDQVFTGNFDGSFKVVARRHAWMTHNNEPSDFAVLMLGGKGEFGGFENYRGFSFHEDNSGDAPMISLVTRGNKQGFLLTDEGDVYIRGNIYLNGQVIQLGSTDQSEVNKLNNLNNRSYSSHFNHSKKLL